MCLLVGDHSLKSLSLGMVVEGFRSHVRKKITMLQYECLLLAISLSFLTCNFLAF
jgi:hypothetical protein